MSGPAGPGAAGELVVRVDRARCVGTGLCAGAAPGDFQLDADGKSRPRRDTTVPSDGLSDAAEFCPVEAITVVDAATGRRVAPLD
ncbi:ferredoxin [Peterkaempfera griseoplana]|uniref:ferredoxin n=1 Tax=Peterkaempfera griseoplana TaxID=66896 RepID=UPI0007C73E89|nr:ferredoxin [Peterkaempfera griseoplana]